MDIAKLLVPDLTGKTALVTGASRGIGRSIATALALCGARVMITARDIDRLEGLREEIGALGGDAIPATADIRDRDAIGQLFETLDRKLGGRLDILVNNAGIGVYGDIVDFDVEKLDDVLAVNVRGVFATTKLALERMIPAKRGAIVNIASVVGVKGYPRQAAYTASKHAVVGFTKSLAIEAQPHGIRVSVICPGGVDTEMIGDARPDLDRSILLKPEDVARTVLYLLSLPDRAAVDRISIRRFASAPF